MYLQKIFTGEMTLKMKCECCAKKLKNVDVLWFFSNVLWFANGIMRICKFISEHFFCSELH